MESDGTFMCGDFSYGNIMPLAGTADGDDEGLGGYGTEPFDLPDMTMEEFDRMVYEALGGTYAPEAEVQEPTEELELELELELGSEPTEAEELERDEEALERERNARQLEEDIFSHRDEAQRQTAESRMADRIEVEPMNWDGNAMRPRQATGTGPVAGGASGTETAGPAEGDLAPSDTGDPIVIDLVEEDAITTDAEDAGAQNATGDTIASPTLEEDVVMANPGGAGDTGAPNATGGTTAVPPTGADVAPTNGAGTETTTDGTITEEMELNWLMVELCDQAKPRRTKRATPSEGTATPSSPGGIKRRRVESGASPNAARGAKKQAPGNRVPMQAARAGPSAPSAGSAGHGGQGGPSRRVSPPLPSHDDSGVRPPNRAPSRHAYRRDINTAGYRPSANSGGRPAGNMPPASNHGRDINTPGYRPSANSGSRPTGNMPPAFNHRRDISTPGYRPSANPGVRPASNASPALNHGRDIAKAGQRPSPAPIVGKSQSTGPVIGRQQFTDIPISGPQPFARVPIAGMHQRAIGPTGGIPRSNQGLTISAGPPGTLSLVPDGDMVWGHLSLDRLTCAIQLPHGFDGVSPTGRAGLLWRGFFNARGDGQWRHHDSAHMTMGQNLTFVAGGRVQGQVDCGEAGVMSFLATVVRGGETGQGYSPGQMRRRWAVMAPEGY